MRKTRFLLIILCFCLLLPIAACKKEEKPNYKNYGGGNKGNYSNSAKIGNNKSTAYVGAPYNFVSFSEKVIELDKDKRINHNEVNHELFTGEIEYEITAQSPIIVGDGKKDGESFIKNSNASVIR